MFNFKDLFSFMAINDAINENERIEREEEHEEERMRWEQEREDLERKHQQEREEWEKMTWGKDNSNPYSDEDEDDDSDEDDEDLDEEQEDDDWDDEDSGEINEEARNWVRKMLDTSGTNHGALEMKGDVGKVSLKVTCWDCIVPKSVCDEKLLTLLKDSQPLLTLIPYDDDRIIAKYESSQNFYDKTVKFSTSTIVVMEFTNVEIVEECRKGNDNTRRGFIADFCETDDKQWEITIGLIDLPEPKYILAYPTIDSVKSKYKPLNEYIGAGRIKRYSAKEFVADKEEEEKKEKALTALLLGFSYHCDEDYLKQVQKGDVFVLVPEPENEVDPYAIAAYRKGQKRAYVMKADARRLADVIKTPTECYVVKVTESSVRVRIEV